MKYASIYKQRGLVIVVIHNGQGEAGCERVTFSGMREAGRFVREAGLTRWN